MTAAAAFSFEDDERKLWAEFHEEIDKRLNVARPSRSNRQDRGWMQPIYGWARNHLPNEENLVRHYAEKEVHQREERANRTANKHLKRYARGEAPLAWMDLGPLPFTLDEQTGLRVRFDAATPDDVETKAKHVRSSARQRAAAEFAVADILDELALRARQAGLGRVALLGDQPTRVNPHPGISDDLDWDDDSGDEQ